MRYDTYIQTIKGKVINKRTLNDPVNGDEYQIQEWKKAGSNAAKIKNFYVENSITRDKGITFYIKDLSFISSKVHTKFIMTVIHYNNNKSISKRLHKINDSLEATCVTGIAKKGEDIPKNLKGIYLTNMPILIFDLEGQKIINLDPRLKGTYFEDIYGGRYTSKSDLLEKIKDHISNDIGLLYGISEIRNLFPGTTQKSIANSFKILEQEQFMDGKMVYVNQKPFYQIFSTPSYDRTFLERIKKTLKSSRSSKVQLERARRDINEIKAKVLIRQNELSRRKSSLDERLELAMDPKSKSPNTDLKLMIKERDRIKRKLTSVDKDITTINALLDQVEDKDIEELKGLKVRGTPKETIKDIQQAQDDNMLNVIRSLDIPSTEKIKLIDEYPQWEWKDEPGELKCNNCGSEWDVSYLEKNLKDGPANFYRCEACGEVWAK